MISFWSVFSASLWFALASLLIYVLRQHENFIMRYGVTVCFIAVLLATVRLLLPLDDGHMIVLRSYTVLPALNSVLKYEIIEGTTVKQLLKKLWLIGVLIGLVVLLCGLLLNRRRLRKLPSLPPSSQVRATIQACGLNKMDVRLTSARIAPMAIGLLRPTICLPDGEYTETELCWILRHEAAHISGHDGWLRLGYLFFRCLFWWNPFAHWGQKSVDDILELRCDKAVLEGASSTERVEYVDALYHVASQLHLGKLSFVGAGPFVQTGKAGILALRAKQALDAPHPYKRVVFAAITLSLVLFAASYAFIIQPAGFPPDMDDGLKIYPSSPETTYLKESTSGGYELWCDNELVGFITENMRNDEAYNKLEVLP